MNTEIQKLEPDQPNDFRNYYYYENDNIKVDVKFVKLDNEKYNKIIKTYYLNTYSENDANKVKERLKLKKFGQATNNDNHTFTKIGEDVFFEINPELKLYYFKKKEIKNKYEHYKKIYYTDEENEENEKLEQLEKNNENNKSFQDSTTYKNINNNDFFNSQQNKKKLVSCRHCGSGDHWSMDCHISKQNKEKEKEKEREVMKINKKYDGDGDGNKNRNRNNDYEPKLKGLKITELDPSLSNNEIKDALAKFGSIVYYNVSQQFLSNHEDLIRYLLL